jgi:hypothetical protein
MYVGIGFQMIETEMKTSIRKSAWTYSDWHKHLLLQLSIATTQFH